LCALPLLFCLLPLPAQAKKGSGLMVVKDGETVPNVRLYKFDKVSFVSVREIAGVYGCRLMWHPIAGKIDMAMNNNQMELFIKSAKFTLNGGKKKLKTATRYDGANLFAPIELLLSPEFSKFTETTSQFNSNGGILTIEKNVNVEPARFYNKQDSARIVVGLKRALSYQVDQDKPDKIVVSFLGGRSNDDSVAVNSKFIKTISARNSGRKSILEISLNSGDYKVEKVFSEDPPCLTIDIAGQSGPSGEIALSTTPLSECQLISETTSANQAEGSLNAGSALPSVAASSEAPAGASAEPVTALAEPTFSKKKQLIVLDAGHGGEDPGAVGPAGTHEKDINLAIVLELEKLFENDKDYQVFLTRKDDTFIPLVERTNLANEKNADLFLSVHCNAGWGKKDDSRGFEIYFLSEKASDSGAAETANFENSVVRFESKPNKKVAKLQALMWSLVVNEFINESSELCCFVTQEITKRIKIDNRGVKQAGFYVLRGTQMPAILVECAFISNYGEEAKLKQKSFQQKIADSIYEGVKKYELRRNNIAKTNGSSNVKQ
jgi:N-acetylmuramoyl-L-alanine amidase